MCSACSLFLDTSENRRGRSRFRTETSGSSNASYSSPSCPD